THEKKEKIFSKRSDVQINTLNFTNFRKSKVQKQSFKPQPDPQMSLQEIAQETLIHTFEFPYLLLDESMEIVYIKGRMQPYIDLSDGSLNASALKVIHKDLHMELRAVFNKVVKNKKPSKTKVIRYGAMEKDLLVRLTAKPLIYPKNEKDYYMLIFEEIDREARYPFSIETIEQDEHKNAIRVMELEQELEATKEHLQTFTEELETSNEELQSLNEELQSTNEELKSSNEELETSNEELQSANEELQTANTELGLSNESLIEKESELTRAKRDLEINRERFELALENSNIFIAYQDEELRYIWVHNKSPKFRNTNILGRSDFELIPESDEVIKMKREVLKNGKPKRKTVQALDQFWDTVVKPQYENGKITGIRTVSVDITEQVTNQRVISQQQSIIRSIVGENDENILAIGTDFRVLVVNSSMKQLVYDLFRIEIKSNDNVQELLTSFPDKNSDTLTLFENALSGLSSSTEGYPSLHTKTGNTRYFDYRIFPLRSDTGNIIGAAMACKEVTDKMTMALNVQNIFQQSANLTGEGFFKDMTSQLSVLFKVKYVYIGLVVPGKNEIKTRALRINGNLSENFTYGLPNSPCERVSINDDEKYIENVREKFPQDPKLHQWNAQSYRGMPVTSPSTGELTAILVMIHDKSLVEPPQSDYILRIMTLRAGAELERQRNENRLRHKDIQLKRVTDNLPEIIFEYEADPVNNRRGNFTYLSTAVNTILETPAKDILKDTNKFWDTIHPEDVASLKKATSESVSGRKQTNWEGRVIGARTGLIKWVKVLSNPSNDEMAPVRKWHGIIEDITRLKTIQIDLLQAKDKADTAAKAKDDFLATMSHEMRTPLNAIVGITNLLMKENQYSELDQNLEALKFSSENLMYLINDILDYSKLEAGKAKLDIGLFHLKQLLKGLSRAHQLGAKEKNLNLTLHCENIPDVVYGDQMKLSQVLNNLLSNAIKFTSEGEISLSVDVPDQNDEEYFVRFFVKDTGMGIPTDQQKFIFERFNQGTHTKPNVRGTGLGLSITKMLLDLMNSSIAVQSSSGKGSEFSFVLPLKKPSESQKEDHSKKAALKKTKKPLELNILVVEDVEINRMVLLQYMKKLWGFKADEAENGKIALQMVKDQDYDVVLMDVRMPVMNGFECSEEIRKMGGKYKSLPIIALTADFNSKVQSLDNGNFSDVLFKPYEPEDLYSKLLKWGKKEKGPSEA
ncbi:MAG: ATP-binding protein, partial [Cyclobacteriaceae bacterium]